jgi:hypothetical protein
MWEYVLGSAFLFGLIVGLFSIYNGRAARKLLMEEGLTREMIERLMEEMDEGFAKMDERFIGVLKEIRQLRSS